MTISVLMYHAIYLTNSELNSIPEEERPYAISYEKFQQQLDLLNENNIQVLSPDIFNDLSAVKPNEHTVLLTFDDGHASFYHYAYPEMLKRKISGIFFVTSELIKERSDFCNWGQLKEMSDNGMSIQSHGKTHKFISDLDSNEARKELHDSKRDIESKLKSSVRSISFPGGRYSQREIEEGVGLGYEFFFTSNEGVNYYKELIKDKIVKRLALRKSTNLDEFLKLSKGNYYTIKKRIVIYYVKLFVKKIIGNSLYHFIYKRRRIS